MIFAFLAFYANNIRKYFVVSIIIANFAMAICAPTK